MNSIDYDDFEQLYLNNIDFLDNSNYFSTYTITSIQNYNNDIYFNDNIYSSDISNNTNENIDQISNQNNENIENCLSNENEKRERKKPKRLIDMVDLDNYYLKKGLICSSCRRRITDGKKKTCKICRYRKSVEYKRSFNNKRKL